MPKYFSFVIALLFYTPSMLHFYLTLLTNISPLTQTKNTLHKDKRQAVGDRVFQQAGLPMTRALTPPSPQLD